MSPTNREQRRVWFDSSSNCHYSLPIDALPRKHDDEVVTEFDSPEQANAFVDEMNASLSECKEDGDRKSIQKAAKAKTPHQIGNVIQPAIAAIASKLGPKATPPAQQGGGTREQVTSGLSADHFRLPSGQVVTNDDLPQYAAGIIDNAGAAWDSLKTVLSSKINLITQRCRLGIADCRQAIIDYVGPVVQEADKARALIKDTISQHVLNTMSSAMEATASLPTNQTPDFLGNQNVKLWRSIDTGECYCLYPYQPPRNVTDAFLGEYPDYHECSVAAANCGSQIPPVPPPQLPQPPIGTTPGPIAPPVLPGDPPQVLQPGQGMPALPPGQVPGQGQGGIQPTPIDPSAQFPGWLWGGIGWINVNMGQPGNNYPPFSPGNSGGGYCCPPGYNLLMGGGPPRCLGPLGQIIPAQPCNTGQIISQPTGQPPQLVSQPLPPPGTISPTSPPGTPPPPPGCCPPPVINVQCAPGQQPTYTGGPEPYPPTGPGDPPQPVIGGILVNNPTYQPTQAIPPVPIPGISPTQTTGEYCDNLFAVRRKLVELGEKLLQGGGMKYEFLVTALNALSGTGVLTRSAFKRQMGIVLNDVAFTSFTRAILAVVKSYKYTFDQELYPLLAVRRFFQMMDTVVVGGSANSAGEVTWDLSLNPNIFGFGGGRESKSTDLGGNSIAAEWKVFIVPLMKTIDRCIAWVCPEEIPSIPQAIQLFLSSQIDLEHCRCLVGLNGGVWDEFLPVIQANRSKVDALQAVQLWMRGKIMISELQAKLRELGFIRDSDLTELIELAKWIPGPSDLVRFMMRDVEDLEVVGKYELDAEFGEKFTGLIERQAEAQGLDRDTALRYWRAHWDWPSNTQLYEMIHRLRPDNRPEGRTAEDWDVTTEMAEKVLGINDVIPGFRQRLIDISYRPLTRVDSRRAFEKGIISKDELISTLQDQGYSKKNAERLAEFFVALRKQALRNNRYVKQYISGWINRDDLIESLKEDSIPEDLHEEIIRYANREISVNTRKVCTQSFRKRYLLGEFTKDELEAGLRQLGMDEFQAKQFATAINCERNTRPKQIAAGQLCKYVERGLITPIDMGQRLLRLNYSVQDANIIVSECGIRIAERQAKEAERLAQKNKAEQEKIKREREKLQKELEKAREREIKARQAVAKRIDAIADRFTKAAARYARVAGIDDASAAARMQSAANSGHNDYGLEVEDALDLATDLAMQWKAKESRDFAVAYDELVRANQNAISSLSSEVNGNGVET